nr:hypothetical protein [uncultured Sphingomonas sp.]
MGLVEFQIGITCLAFYPLHRGDAIAFARDFDRRHRRIFRRHEKGDEQAPEEADRHRRGNDHLPSKRYHEILIENRRFAIRCDYWCGSDSIAHRFQCRIDKGAPLVVHLAIFLGSTDQLR